MPSDSLGIKQWVGCAAENFLPGRPGTFRPEAIVIHSANGTLKHAAERVHDPATTVSAHYGVGKNGEVHQYVDERDTAFHAGVAVNPTWRLMKVLRRPVNPNFYTIGIEHEGTPDEAWGDPLYDASAGLIAEIAARWNFPLDKDRVVMHSQIRASRNCPGPQVRIHHLIELAAGKEAFPVLPVLGFAPQVRLLARANGRAKPTTEARIVRVLDEGDSFHPGGCTAAGERIAGNSFWYFHSVERCYFWAGATDYPQPV